MSGLAANTSAGRSTSPALVFLTVVLGNVAARPFLSMWAGLGANPWPLASPLHLLEPGTAAGAQAGCLAAEHAIACVPL